jgi:spermidine synthase
VSWFFIFFFFSGFCSVLYELVWLRLAMAQFGVTTAMVSIILSVFMAGLGLGSWASGRWLRRREQSSEFPALRLYALIELLIGMSAIVVPHALWWGRAAVEHYGLSSSAAFYFTAGMWVAVTLVPWCCLMGATVPVAMRAIGQMLPAESGRSFSYLYMANVAGAVVGTTVPLLMIELLGFRGTLKVGAACNCVIAVSAVVLSFVQLRVNAAKTSPAEISTPALDRSAEPIAQQVVNSAGRRGLMLLFLSGLTCMAMEVVWVRRYTPYLGTVVYAFASILGVYLVGTVIGSVRYRRWSLRNTRENPAVWIWLASFGLLPLVAASPSIGIPPFLRLVLGIVPFTGLLGFVTPMLVDRFSGGDPAKAGTAYAVNVSGCILGPLVAGFGLLPFVSERAALILLAAPWFVVGLAPLRRGDPDRTVPPIRTRFFVYSALALAAMLIAAGKGYDENFPGRRVLRDSTATVMATGAGMDKALLVNGYGMTALTPITKVMAHLPLAFLDRPPQNALVICFGMGTTFRALHSWGIPVTAVELVPSVPRLFTYYHDDGDAILTSPLSQVVIDDGRRYLERTTQQYDVITIDPPPPLEAAASSLLYSKEFYEVARRRLRPGGILQQWLPTTSDSDAVDVAAVTRSLRESFPYVRAFLDEFGIHYLCSDRPLSRRTAEDLVGRMPADAVSDFTEWAEDEGAASAALQFSDLLKQELVVDQLISASPSTPALTDDRPINEYYAVRQWLHPDNPSAASRGSQ